MRGCLLVETLIKMHKSLKKSLCGIVLNSVSSPGYTVLLAFHLILIVSHYITLVSDNYTKIKTQEFHFIILM